MKLCVWLLCSKKTSNFDPRYLPGHIFGGSSLTSLTVCYVHPAQQRRPSTPAPADLRSA